MNDQVKFKRLQELVSALQEGLDELNIGKLTIEQLDSLTDHSRELFERMVILKYKAYDTEVKKSTEVKKEDEGDFSVPFKLSSAATPNQVSLIDAIEEVTAQSVEPDVQQETPAYEPTISELAAKHEIEFTFEVPEEPKVAQPAASVAQSINQVMQSITPQESLNDRLSKSVGSTSTVAQKMEHTPIPDLKRAITLNQRFQFSKELFKGNNQEYEVAIDRLNNTSREEALRQLEQLKSKYVWNNESQVTQDFIELIERRHQG
jgi:hypothetical protein